MLPEFETELAVVPLPIANTLQVVDARRASQFPFASRARLFVRTVVSDAERCARPRSRMLHRTLAAKAIIRA
jgi:hypothetical protein